MPCALCTTGSPTLSSLRSLISASTSLTCSCFLRRRVVGPAANSSVSVTKSMPPSTQAKPLASAAVAMPVFSSLAWNSASESKAGGFRPLARRKSSRLSRRPSLSASSSTRCGGVADVGLQPGQRVVGAAHRGQVGQALHPGAVFGTSCASLAQGQLRVRLGAA
jgi:hypothetical protein